MPFNATTPGTVECCFFPAAAEDQPDWLASNAEYLHFEEVDEDPVVCSICHNEDGDGRS
jgi:hypothetical protein